MGKYSIGVFFHINTHITNRHGVLERHLRNSMTPTAPEYEQSNLPTQLPLAEDYGPVHHEQAISTVLWAIPQALDPSSPLGAEGK